MRHYPIVNLKAASLEEFSFILLSNLPVYKRENLPKETIAILYKEPYLKYFKEVDSYFVSIEEDYKDPIVVLSKTDIKEFIELNILLNLQLKDFINSDNL